MTQRTWPVTLCFTALSLETLRTVGARYSEKQKKHCRSAHPYATDPKYLEQTASFGAN